MMPPLPNDARRALLELARRSITEAVQHDRPLAVPFPTGDLAQATGVFVTLRRRGRLRGCIGQVEAIEPLALAVPRCAAAAALEDPRFEKMQPAELADLDIEISVLSALRPIAVCEIELGRHGLVVTRGHQRGLLLPQVAADFHWTPEHFLEETCRKGGLGQDDWKDPATRVEGFTAEIFSDEDFRAESQARAG